MTYTQILREFATHEVFLACGDEGRPLELKKNGNKKHKEPYLPTKRTSRKLQTPVIHRRKSKENKSMSNLYSIR